MNPNTDSDRPLIGPDVDDFDYRAPQACQLVGVTYRQLDYWARSSVVVPTGTRAYGSGTHRIYRWEDIVELGIVRALLDVGLMLGNIRKALLTYRSVRDSAGDGLGLYLVRDPYAGWSCVDAGEIDRTEITIQTVLSVDWIRNRLEAAILTGEPTGRSEKPVAV